MAQASSARVRSAPLRRWRCGMVIEKVVSEKQAKIVATNHWEDGPHHLYEIEYQGKRLAFIHPGVGAPMAAGILEDAVAHGCRKFIVCGGCGVLEKGIAVGHLIVVSSAIRDEGTSYHYLPPSREVTANPLGIAARSEEHTSELQSPTNIVCRL